MMIVGSALKSFDLDQERVARSLGATRTQAFLQVTAPQIGFALVTSAVLSFLTSFDEVVVALLLTGPGQRTLPRQMFAGINDNISLTITAAGTMLVLLACVLLVVAEALRRRSEQLRTSKTV